MNTAFALQSFVGLLAILNPIGAVPMYLAFTDGRDHATARRVARTAAVTALVTLLVFMLVGSSLLAFFGVSLAAFKVGGGVLLITIGITLLHGRISRAKLTEEEVRESSDWQSVAIVPLGLPLLAGPGTISTAIVLGNEAADIGERLVLVVVIFCVCLVTLLTFLAAERVHHVLGRTGITVIGRVMGLILTAVAVQFMADGLLELFPALRGD